MSSPLAANLLAEMKRTGMPISYLARQLEVSEKQVARWRKGQQPRYKFVVRLADVFGREPAWFFVDRNDDGDNEVAA